MTQREDRPIHRFTLLWLSIRQRRDMWHIDLTPTLTPSANGELGPIDLFCCPVLRVRHSSVSSCVDPSVLRSYDTSHT
jgi:hypothetical protein